MSALETARAKRAEARFHHTQAAWHRKRARALMREIREFCEAAGVDFEVVAGGHGRNDDPDHSQ